jgi:hypothetical protein
VRRFEQRVANTRGNDHTRHPASATIPPLAIPTTTGGGAQLPLFGQTDSAHAQQGDL